MKITNNTLLLNIPTKFFGILTEAINYRIKSMQQLLGNPDSTDEQLAYIDYGNDQVILTMILDALKNPHNQVNSAFYQLTQNAFLNILHKLDSYEQNLHLGIKLLNSQPLSLRLLLHLARPYDYINGQMVLQQSLGSGLNVDPL